MKELSENLNVINTLAHVLNDAELSDAIHMLHQVRNERQGEQLVKMKSGLAKGDKVEFYHSQRKEYIRGTVKKVKTKKALVVEEGHPITARHMTWDVPMGMLKRV